MHEYISSKYNNENKEECEQNQHTPPVEFKDIITQENKDTPTPLQASNSLGLEVEGGILTNQHTPLLTGKDTNILRVNNINNNTHARVFNDKTYTIDFADKNNDINKLAHTDSAEIKSLNTEEKESSYADLAFGSLAKPTQSASREDKK